MYVQATREITMEFQLEHLICNAITIHDFCKQRPDTMCVTDTSTMEQMVMCLRYYNEAIEQCQIALPFNVYLSSP